MKNYLLALVVYEDIKDAGLAGSAFTGTEILIVVCFACFFTTTISARLRSRSRCFLLLLMVILHLCNHLIRVLWGSPSHLGIRSGHAAA